MCGICGIINFDGKPISIDELILMRDSMQHRGPDDCGAVLLNMYGNNDKPVRFRDKNDLNNLVSLQTLNYSVGLAHRRLAIIDLSENAHQPMSDTQERYYIVYNGEIYNFQELRSELEKIGYRFRSRSDTEVVLYSYIHWGLNCIEKFNGMFAFAIWDSLKKELFLARDRFGKKPLYYFYNINTIIFASELTALAKCKNILSKISLSALNCYLAIGYIVSPYTLYEGIHKLEAAHCIFISNYGKNFHKYKYWDYGNLFRRKIRDNFKEVVQKIYFLLDEAVKRRMISDVPIGAFLSGGLDSSIIVALMKKYYSFQQLHTFSIGFKEQSYNELFFANKVAKYLDTVHHKEICNKMLLDEAIYTYDELFADNSLIPTVQLANLASKYVKVVLTGDGADELFMGYLTYKADQYHRWFFYSPKIIKSLMLYLVNKLFPVKNRKISFEFKLKQFLLGSFYSPQQAHYLWRVIFLPEERLQILGEEYKNLIYDTDPWIYFKKYYEEVSDLDIFEQHLYVDAKTWLTDDILVKLDRATMRFGLEARCPYLDIDLVTYVSSLPYTYKLRVNPIFPFYVSKWILRKIGNNSLPKFILRRKKEGFNTPIGIWFNDSSMNEFKIFNKLVFDKKINKINNAKRTN